MICTCVDLKILPVKKNFNLIREVNKLAKSIYIFHHTKCLNALLAKHMYNTYQTAEAIVKAINEGEEYYILNLENKNIGYFSINSDIEKGKLFISKFYLDQKIKCQDLAKYVMNMLIQKYEALNASNFQIYAPINTPIIEVCKKWGFKILKKVYRYISPEIQENYYLISLDI